MIRMSDTKAVAGELHTRYDPARAVVLIGRLLQRALFAGRSDDVLFWALVHAHYRGGDLCDATEEQLSAFSRFIQRDRSDLN
ncbi:hypothetical protein SAMN05519103_09016 [Rhizobiales bacterium GAS113]|nr:hypothetical protein SAMN05519103_09016 [Rhizobiales bacterium GAS113]